MSYHGWDPHQKKNNNRKFLGQFFKMAAGFKDGCLHFEKEPTTSALRTRLHFKHHFSLTSCFYPDCK